MIKDTIDGYISDKVAELAQLDDDLANMIITQQYYDDNYPLVEEQKDELTLISNKLLNEIGVKQAGNFTNLENLILNKEKTMDEMNRSISKIIPSDCVDSEYVEAIYGTLKDGIDSLIGLVDIDIDLPAFKDTTADIIAYKDFLTSIETSIGDIKNKVGQYIDSIRDLSNSIGYIDLQGSDCADAMFSKLTSYKSVGQLADIDNLKTSTNVGQTINNKLDSFKIS